MLKQVIHVRNERNTLGTVVGHPFITQMRTSFSDSHSLHMLLEYTLVEGFSHIFGESDDFHFQRPNSVHSRLHLRRSANYRLEGGRGGGGS